MRNTGFNLGRQLREKKPTDYKLGAMTPRCLVPVSKDEFLKYLPPGEVQVGKEDFSDCASRSPINNLEAKLTKFITIYPNHDFTKWLYSKGYVVSGKVLLSDRFIAILSGTDRDGNSLVGPLHTLHKVGFIPKKLLPRESTMTFDEYHDKSKITPLMIDLGLESLTWVDITYWETDLKAKDDIACTAGHAWPYPKNGVYPRTDETFNHAFITVPEYVAFDNYPEDENDFIKDLASDFKLLPGYRLVLQLKKKPTETEIYKASNWFTQILNHIWTTVLNFF